MPDVPHLAWPFRVARGRLAQVEQDGIEDVQQNVYSYLATSRGERPLSPDFGLEDPSFAPGVSTQRVAAAIEEAEQGRAVVTVTATGPGADGRMSVAVSVALVE